MGVALVGVVGFTGTVRKDALGTLFVHGAQSESNTAQGITSTDFITTLFLHVLPTVGFVMVDEGALVARRCSVV